MQSELELARQASSDTQGEILKGTVSGKALEFKIRSCFAFSSIGTSAVQRADTSRISVLSLTKPGDPDRFKEIIKFWKTVINPEYCEKSRARTIKLIPTIRANATMFTQAIAEQIGSQRTGDQVGTIIAGTHAFHAIKKLNIDGAREWVERQNWDEHVTTVDQLDENRCLSRLMQTVIRVQGERNTYDLSIGELLHIAMSTMTEHPGVTSDAATAALLRHGIKQIYDGTTDGMRIAVSNTHHSIAKALEKTPWASDWGQFLARIPGARKTDKTLYFGPGSNAKAVSLPLDVLGEG
jgi:putative DNA primase/helicase